MFGNHVESILYLRGQKARKLQNEAASNTICMCIYTYTKMAYKGLNSSPGVFLLSAFTANLASFLVVKADLKAGFSNVREAIAQHKTIAMSRGFSPHNWFAHAYPNYVHTVPVVESLEDMGRKLVTGTYDSALLAKFEIDKLRHDPEVNPKCTLRHVGDPVLTTQGGWVVFQDMETHCTLLVREVLAIWFLRLEMEGRLRQIVGNSIRRDDGCPEARKKDDDDLKPLHVQNVLGILILHGLGMLVALVFWRVQAARTSQSESSITP